MTSKKLTIAIDIQTTLAQKTGFGFYVSNLVEELNKTKHRFEYALIAPPNRSRDLSTPERFWWDQFGFPLRAYRAQADLIHQPAFSVPIIARAKIVVTVHDLIARLFASDIQSLTSRTFFGRWMPATYRHADHIIVVSEYSKRDLIRELSIPEEKMTVIYEAAGAEYQPVSDQIKIHAAQKKYQIDGPYLIHVGTINPRKNLYFLVEVFAELIKRHPKLKLVIAGKRGSATQKIEESVSILGLKDRVIFTDYLPDEDKILLLTGATGLVFPSLYEGFGLPPLEAMAVGVPVIASNVTSIPEIVGDAGILLDPTQHKDWIKALGAMVNQTKLREELRQKGFARAKMFSWQKTAEQTATVYEKVLHS